tara:strand:- start:1308 stop:1451 length:144 start_codon:yes stop_codon:yes gene_type:complete
MKNNGVPITNMIDGTPAYFVMSQTVTKTLTPEEWKTIREEEGVGLSD